jgi:hypothetical protein
MIWLAGVSPLAVVEAGLGAAVALAFFGGFAARQQTELQPLVKDVGEHKPIDFAQLGIVLLILVGAIVANLWRGFPALGVWAAIGIGAMIRTPDLKVVPGAAKGMAFLLCLVMSASMMPVEQLPEASWQTALVLGVVSAFFDNIPLTALAIKQGGYDWGYLAYCVGYGGSMLWFGSSAGVALSGIFPQAKSAWNWLRHGWHVAVGYFLGFAAMLMLLGWHPQGDTVHGKPATHGSATEHAAPAPQQGR